MSDDDDDIESTMTSSMATAMEPRKDLARVFKDLEWLLKEGPIIAALTARGVNASLGLVAVHGLRAYLIEDNKVQAAEDFATVSEEIFGRLAATAIYETANGISGGGGGGDGDGDGS